MLASVLVFVGVLICCLFELWISWEYLILVDMF